jgi:hypothetical protein
MHSHGNQRTTGIKRRWPRRLATALLLALCGCGFWFSAGWRRWPQVEVFEVQANDPPPSPSFREVFGLRHSSSPPRLTTEPITTLGNRPALSPRGDPRDYVSVSIYWWPNPLTGLPWWPRDGAKNPITADYDSARLTRMVHAVTALVAAAQPATDARAAEWLRAWFITPETRMHPHLTYAQMMPGIAAGGRQGIIEGLPLTLKLLDAIAMLEQRGTLHQPDRAALRQWMESYLTWLLKSRPGRSERVRKNNHGTWYDVQVAALALALGKQPLLTSTLTTARDRLGAQIVIDGRQPEELRRADGISYSLYNLDAWLHLAALERHTDSHWISDPQTGGKPIETAIAYLERVAPEKNQPAVRAMRKRWKAFETEGKD